MVDDIDDAVARATGRQARRPRALHRPFGQMPPRCFPRLLRRGVEIDVVTDQTSAHDPLNGYVPKGLDVAAAAGLRARDPKGYVERAMASMVEHVTAMVGFQRAGARVFDYGNNIRGQARLRDTRTRSRFPASCPRTSGRCSARATDRSAGSRSRAIRATSPPPTTSSWSCFRTSQRSRAGSRSRARAWSFRGCPRASAGSSTANARASASA